MSTPRWAALAAASVSMILLVLAAAPPPARSQPLTRAQARARVATVRVTAASVSSFQSGLHKESRGVEAKHRAKVKQLTRMLRSTSRGSSSRPARVMRLARAQLAMALRRARSAALNKKTYRRQLVQARQWAKRSQALTQKLASRVGQVRYARMDEVIFLEAVASSWLARWAVQLGKRAQAKVWSKRLALAGSQLVRNFPRTRLIAEAMVLLGDHHLVMGNAVAALPLLMKVSRFKGSSLIPYATLKLGRAYSAVGRHRVALGAFVRLLRNRRAPALLHRAARRDLVRAYVHVGRPDKAYNFFQAMNRGAVGKGAVVRKMLVTLGYAFHAAGKHANAGALFREALRRWPRQPDRCQWALGNLGAARAARKRRGAGGRAVNILRRVARSLSAQLGPRHKLTRACQNHLRAVRRRP